MEDYKEESTHLGSGSYGCTFTPPLHCKRTKSRKTHKKVGKIMRKDEAKLELTISTLIESIPEYSEYFVIQEKDRCNEENFKYFRETKKEFSKCPTSVIKSKDTSLTQLLSPFSGVPLYEYKLTHNFSIILFMKHLLKGIDKLKNQGICHFDIKEGNIVVDSKHIARFIDFGISFQGDTITEDKLAFYAFPFSPEYNSLSPEVTVQNGVFKNIQLSKTIPQTIYHKRILQTKANLLGELQYHQEQELRDFFYEDEITVEAQNTKSWVKWYQTYWTKWDPWAIGVVFLKLYQRCLLHNWFEDENKKKGFLIKYVLKGLLEVDPRKRFSAKKALDLLG